MDKIIEKLDVDSDGFIPLDDIVSLAEGEGLGIVLEVSSVLYGLSSLTDESASFRSKPKDW